MKGIFRFRGNQNRLQLVVTEMRPPFISTEGCAAMSRHVLLSALFCVVLLESLPAQGKRSVADLVADLKKSDKERFQALQELESLGDKAADAVPALIDLLDRKDEDVRLQATIVLGKIGRPAVEPLTKALTSKD